MAYRQGFGLKKRILLAGVDPSINNTGISFVSFNEDFTEPVLRHSVTCKVGKDMKGLTLQKRVKIMCGKISHEISMQTLPSMPHVWIEEPPLSGYNQKFLSKDGAIARCCSMFSNFAVVYHLNSLLSNKGYSVKHANPVHWQIKGGPRGRSKQKAKNHVIKNNMSCSGEHEYDATCMLLRIAEKFRDGKANPNLSMSKT